MSKVRCFNYQKHGHFACDCKERRTPRLKNKSDYRIDIFENQGKFNPKKTRKPRYRNNVVKNQSKYFLVFSLSNSSFVYSFDSWLVDSGVSKHFTRYKEALSNVIERETNLNVILGDNSTHQVKYYGSF